MSLDNNIEQKIVQALERISQAMRILAWKASKELQLNPVQMQILVYLLQHTQRQNTISSLAKEFSITKASISDSVSSLASKNLIQKTFLNQDGRNFNIQLSTDGLKVAKEVSAYADGLSAVVNSLPLHSNQNLFSTLNKIIFGLHTQGIISQRMCMTCRFHEKHDGQNLCKLLEKILNINQLQIDCPDHQVA